MQHEVDQEWEVIDNFYDAYLPQDTAIWNILCDQVFKPNWVLSECDSE